MSFDSTFPLPHIDLGVWSCPFPVSGSFPGGANCCAPERSKSGTASREERLLRVVSSRARCICSAEKPALPSGIEFSQNQYGLRDQVSRIWDPAEAALETAILLQWKRAVLNDDISKPLAIETISSQVEYTVSLPSIEVNISASLTTKHEVACPSSMRPISAGLLLWLDALEASKLDGNIDEQ